MAGEGKKKEEKLSDQQQKEVLQINSINVVI
jgi:hypothetical protein